MFTLKTVTLHLVCIACLCLVSQVVTALPPNTTELGSHNENSSDTLLESLWKIEWGPLPKNIADMNTILWYSLSQNNDIVDMKTIDHLRECLSVGKNCKDVLSAKLDGPLALLTNCTINIALSPGLCDALQKCSDTSALLSSLGQDMRSITVSELDDLLPLLIYQVSEGHCRVQGDGSLSQNTNMNKKPTPAEIWGYGLLFVTLISGCSLAGVAMLPLIGRHFYQHLLTTLVGLAMGSLAASSLFHLIPQAFHMNNHTGNHDYLFTSLYVLLGVWGFFMVERLIKIIMVTCSKSDNKKPPLISETAAAMLCNSDPSSGDGPHINSIHVKGVNGNSNNSLTCASHNEQQIYHSNKQIPGKSDHHSHEIEFQQGKDSVIKTVAWMIIFGDGFHNFIDGVSIGAAFSESILTGVSISLAVMCEELPHELGDFAVLLNAGMSMKQAVMYNFLSALTCYLGLVLGILLGEFTQNSTAIFAAAAGMFLYIALSDMIPEMNEAASKATNEGLSASLLVLLLQNIGIFLGIFSLFILAYFQDAITLG